jgi:hypothetical protein
MGMKDPGQLARGLAPAAGRRGGAHQSLVDRVVFGRQGRRNGDRCLGMSGFLGGCCG